MMSKMKQFIKKHIGISALQAEIDKLQKDAENSRNYIEKLQKENEKLKKRIDSMDGWLRKTREDLWEENGKIAEVRKKNHALENQIKSYQLQIEKQDDKIEKQKEQIQKQFIQIKDADKKNQLDRKLMEYNIYKYMDETKYAEALSDWYYKKMGKMLNLEHPKTFNEIIQWTKLYDMNEDKIALVDKYLVRDWVKKQIGEKYLIPLLGVWDQAEQIDFNQLPEQFVLKCNHGCGYNIIVTDKASLNENDTRKRLNDWLQEDFSFKNGFELQYSQIKRRIIAEEYIENNNEDLYDYKVFCFNGKAKYIMFLSDRKNGLKMQFYDLEWNLQPFVYSYERNENTVAKPDNLSELIECAEKLAKDFIQVRVDFYLLNDGSWKFGEMTFTSASGIAKWEPEEYDRILGDMIDCSLEGV